MQNKQIGISLCCMKFCQLPILNFTILKSLLQIKKKSIEQIELPLYGGMSLLEAEQLRKAIMEHGVSYLSIHLPKDFFDFNYPFSRIHMFRILNVLHPKLLVAHPPIHSSMEKYVDEIQDYLQKEHVQTILTFENVPYFPYNKLLSLARTNGWGITADFQHSCNQGISLEDPITPYIGLLKNIHIRDFDRKQPQLYIPPGEGEIPFDKVFEKLKAYGYKGPLFLECPMDSEEKLDASYSHIINAWAGRSG